MPLFRPKETQPYWPTRPTPLRRTDDIKIYESYCRYCETIGSKPLELNQWLLLRHR